MTTAQTLVGQDFGIYHIEKFVTSVDVVDVFQAADSLYERPVHVRILRPEYAEDRRFVQTFVSAGRSAMRLRHENILAVADAGQIDGFAYIAVEAIHTESLAAYVERQPALLPQSFARHILQQIAIGLQYAHREGFVHGRLNPNVVRITADKRVLISDFELEQVWSDQSVTNQTIWRQIVNPHFLAPEQVSGVEEIGPEVDLFSLGTIAYWLASGKLPFNGANALAIMRQIADVIPVHPSKIEPSISTDLEQTILRALQKSPAERTGSADEFLAGLAGKAGWREVAVGRDDSAPGRYETPLTEIGHRPFGEDSTVPDPIVKRAHSAVAIPASQSAEPAEETHETTLQWYTDRGAAGIAVFVVAGALVLLVLVSLLQSASMLMERIVEGGQDTRAAVVVLPTVTPTPNPVTQHPEGSRREDGAQQPSNDDMAGVSEAEASDAGNSSGQQPVEEIHEALQATATVEKVSTRALRVARADSSAGIKSADPGEPVLERWFTATSAPVKSGRIDAVPYAKLVTTPTRTPVPSNTPEATATMSATPSPTVTPTPSATPTPEATSTATAAPTVEPTSTLVPDAAGQAEAVSAFTDPASSQPQPTPQLEANLATNDAIVFTGRIAFTLWNPHSDRPDVYIWYANNETRSVAIANRRQPDINSSGNLVANAEGGGYDNIVMMGRYGEDPWVISEHPEDAHPHWSMDGKRVVFDSAHMGDRQHRIYLQSDLEHRRELPPMMYEAWELFGRYPIFLADNRIAFHGCNYWDTGSICGIHVVDIQGGRPTTATGWPGDIPTDNLGSDIIFMSDRNGSWDVYRMHADGSNLRRLTDSPASDGLATASPDGDYIAFLSDRDGDWAVYAIPSSGGDAHLLFHLDGHFGRGEYNWLQERLSWGR